MLRKKIAVISVVIAGLMSGFTGVTASAQTAEQLDNGLWVDGFRVGTSRTGRIAMFFYGENNNGKLAICGGYYMWGGGFGIPAV